MATDPAIALLLAIFPWSLSQPGKCVGHLKAHGCSLIWTEPDSGVVFPRQVENLVETSPRVLLPRTLNTDLQSNSR